MRPERLTQAEQQSLVRLEISKWFDSYHNALMQLRTRAEAQHIPFELHSFVKSQGERFGKGSALLLGKPRLKCLVLLTPYHLDEIRLLIADYAQQAQAIVERFELKKFPKLLETPLIIEDIIAVNFTKNPAISILTVEPDEVIEWFEHQLEMIHNNMPVFIENQKALYDINQLNESIEYIKKFKNENDGSQLLKRFYQSGFSYRATLRFANHTKKVMSLNEFLFIVGYGDQLPRFGDSTLLPYPRKKRADTIVKSDRNIVAETTNELHYYFSEPKKEFNA
ncbi:hypothetical protein BKE30_10585 [Alkanindiges hydrocarboniclasticus]|jgi:hypothetical protein|uniref:Uncharacterized protein n=1 Tax=Alkanindiges hydrocarboniclasticus TaxID=1907941 RepID=A0A1S8CSH7_9GAMM|nr:hypothetical protein [Alkanindiges hydrocarboniclasticus]ONG38921.1 hypothetical protein BKE30_10585 [Alkanindiges hydrocarboniclasticus]